MQKQSGLQCSRDRVGPEDGPVEAVQRAGVLERVQDKGGQAEDVEVRRFGRGPSAKQDINTDAQVSQSDQSKAIVGGAVRGLKDHLNIELGGGAELAFSGRSHDGVIRMSPDATAEDLALQSR